jgi:hypothetical protein
LPKRSNFNMPNKHQGHKLGRTRQRATDRSNHSHRPDSVKELLATVTPALTRVADQGVRQQFWCRFLAERLPPGLALRLSGVVERQGTLVVFAESAAWSARLRYAMQELEAAIRSSRPTIQQVQVRVLPRA